MAGDFVLIAVSSFEKHSVNHKTKLEYLKLNRFSRFNTKQDMKKLPKCLFWYGKLNLYTKFRAKILKIVGVIKLWNFYFEVMKRNSRFFYSLSSAERQDKESEWFTECASQISPMNNHDCRNFSALRLKLSAIFNILTWNSLLLHSVRERVQKKMDSYFWPIVLAELLRSIQFLIFRHFLGHWSIHYVNQAASL